MHTDEAVNGYITGQLLAGQPYQYDPQDRHGPALYLAAVPASRLAGQKHLSDLTEPVLRSIPAIFSFLTVLLFAVVAKRIGFISAILGALLFAVAPLPVYYGRYFIHEMLFVFGTLAFLLSGLRVLESRSHGAAALGASAAFMLACKETAVLHFAAAAVPLVWWLWAERNSGTGRRVALRQFVSPAANAFVAFVLVTLAFYTWGGRNWEGPVDLLKSFPRFAQRAGGEGHEKPYYYYGLLLGGSGAGWGLIGLAIYGTWLSLKALRSSATRTLPLPMLGFYCIAILILYSAIPYKNPWLGLNLWLPIALLAGVGFQKLWFARQRAAARAALILGATALLALSGQETWKWGFARPSDDRNPYAYAHTVEDLLGLPERLKALTHTNTARVRISVVASDPWPLPWYLRRFSRVGYYQPGQDPGVADFYVSSLEPAPNLEARAEGWRSEFFGVRPEVLLLLWTPPAAGIDE